MRVFRENVYALGELRDKAPKLFGIKTGTKLDELFYTVEVVDGKAVKKPLGGIPYQAVMNVVGAPDTGKSILGEQFALTQAALGYRVVILTTESPAHFLYNSMKVKATALGYRMEEVEKNIVVVDASTNDELRENLPSLLKTMEYAIRLKGATVTVIDSITGLYEHKEMLARQIVRKVYNFLKEKRQTSLLISQKRSSQQSGTAEAAGGLAVAHIVDGTIVMEKRVISTTFEQRLYRIPLGHVLRTLRIDGCRLTGHDSRTWVFEITDFGTIELIMPLDQFIRRGELHES